MIAAFIREGSRRLTDDQLVAELNALGVHFLSGGNVACVTPPVSPVELFAGSASSKNARIRSAIIPLLLIHPVLTDAIPHSKEFALNPVEMNDHLDTVRQLLTMLR